MRVVRAALTKHDKHLGKRFLGIVGSSFVFFTWMLPIVFPAITHPPYDWLQAAGFGVSFFGYLLWEINGPVLKAVEKYCAAGGSSDDAS